MTDETTIWVFADVDDSLIEASRECPEEGAQAMAFFKDGNPCGWLTPRQRQFLTLLDGRALLVPTTARTSNALGRVHVPYSGYAIVSFGGVIRMPDGTAEPRWHSLIWPQSRAAQEELSRLACLVHSVLLEEEIDCRAAIACDDGMSLFLSVKHSRGDRAELKRLSEHVSLELKPGWQLHLNGNFLSVLPPFLNKERAVIWFRHNIAHPESLTIGLGDSASDVPFQSACDMALMPVNSQSFTALLEGGS